MAGRLLAVCLELLRLMMQSVVGLDWQPSPPMLPEVPAGWAGEVAACVSHWLRGWARGSRGRAMNVCCHDGRWGQTSVLCPHTDTLLHGMCPLSMEA